MSEIETLTDADREYLGDCNHRDRGPKALRIIDAQAKRIAELEATIRAAKDSHCPHCSGTTSSADS